MGGECRGADVVGVGRLALVHAAAHRGHLAIRATGTLVGITPGHVEHSLVGLASGIQPTFHHLDTVEVGTIRILTGLHQESRNLPLSCSGQITAHRHAFGTGRLGPIRRLDICTGVVVPPVHPHRHSGATGAEHLLARHGIPQRSPGVARRPNPCQARSPQLQSCEIKRSILR